MIVLGAGRVGMLVVMAKTLMLVDLVSAVPKRRGFLELTTNNRTIGLDVRPNDGVARAETEQIC